MPPNTRSIRDLEELEAAPPESALGSVLPYYDDSFTVKTMGSRSSRGGRSQTSRSIVTVPLEKSILRMVSTVREVEQCEEDDAADEAEKHCCRRNYHLCCCCCCDLIRACIITNTIYFFIMIFLIVFVTYAAEEMGLDMNQYDDEFQEEIGRFSNGSVIRSSIGMPMSILGSVGAYKQNKWLVLVMFLWYCAYLIWAILGTRYFSAIFAGLLLYPNAALFLALHHGKITRENYATSVQQCCSPCPESKKE